MRRYQAVLYASMFAAYLAGGAAVARTVPAAQLALGSGSPMHLAAPDLFDVDAAASVLDAKRLLPKREFDALSAGYKRYAFTVAWVDSNALLETVRSALSEAVRKGRTYDTWRTTVDAAFESSGYVHPGVKGERTLMPWHLETVFETNVMSAYSAANWDLLRHPDVVGIFPKYLLNVIDDGRTSPICLPLIGTVLPADHPFWLTHWPPLHYRCRSTVIGLDVERARAFADVIPPETTPQTLPNGFGASHGARDQWRIGNDLLSKAGTAPPDWFLTAPENANG